MLPLEGERTDYRFAVIRGRKGKIGDEVGLRQTYTLMKKSPEENQPAGAEAEPEKEPEELEETPNEEAPTEVILEEETSTEEVLETVPEETPEVPPSEEAPLIEEALVEEEPAIEEVVAEEVLVEEITPEPEPIPEPELEPEMVEEVIEPEVINDPLQMIFTPESPVYCDGQLNVTGKLIGFENTEQLYVTVEKSTSEENGWIGWAERDVRYRGERTPALTYTNY